ncbi:MAG: putative manganese-dependent inorganic diphosphatase [Oscillospiraceae bacterium]|nr:putative manganese-dependent inorganic diphosphatase [Oscillospiraceae bacterium]
MEKKREIIVIGHKNPDSDSICSAIAYAQLKNQLGGGNYVAKRAGDINKETAFVLNYFGVEEPEYVADVRTRVSDIDWKRVPGVDRNMSVREAYLTMKDNDTTTLCITNEEDMINGIITMTDIAGSDMDVHDNHLVSRAKTPFRNIMKTLDARVLCGDVDRLFDEGRVCIGANTPERMVDYISKGDLVILGDRFESQFFAIEIGASCIVLCTDSEPNPTILELARARECIILSSPYDSYTVARLVNQSMPIGHFMLSKNILSFELEDFASEVKEVMSKERHRYFPVTDHQGHYLGMISKRNLLALDKKQVILVDHNEKNQAVDGIQSADIQEIIDHHRLGGMESINPLLFRNHPLGCTATIIYQIAKENGVELTRTMAGLLCSAILSDTLMFRSPTCTAIDKTAAEALAEIAGIEIEEYAHKMFEAGSDLSSRSIEEIFYQDYKTFSTSGKDFGVGQITSVSRAGLQQMQGKLLDYMEEKHRQNPDMMYFFMLTNIIEESSIVLGCGSEARELLEMAYNKPVPAEGTVVEGLVSRKKQLLPDLIAAIQQ